MRKLSIAIAVTGVAVALAACSSSTPSSKSSPATGASRSTTQAAGAGIDAAAFVAQATAATDKAQTVKIKESMSLLGIPITASGVAKLGDQTADADVTSDTPIGPVQVIIVDGDVYTKGLIRGNPSKPWTKNAGEAKEIASALRQADPRLALKMFSDVGTLKQVGTETVNGVSATHYSVTVELAKVAAQHPELADILKVLIQNGVKTQNVQLWVDSQQRPVRISMSAQLTNPVKPGAKINSTQSVDFTDWGAPVTIQAPPADQVAN
ncbi:MAG TPA: LppX_LprAFG lipoprotein [Jatrophihabitantaceae bacterium]|jgi:hypothetical protein